VEPRCSGINLSRPLQTIFLTTHEFSLNIPLDYFALL
jgi:hypothetical protein